MDFKKPFINEENIKHDDFRGAFLNDKLLNSFPTSQISFVTNLVPFTFRGLHWQISTHPDSKIIKVIDGAVIDILMDIDRKSPTFGTWDEYHLTNARGALIVPAGFAHGYLTLEPNTRIAYCHSGKYNSESQRFMSPLKCGLGADFLGKIAVLSDRDREGCSIDEAYY